MYNIPTWVYQSELTEFQVLLSPQLQIPSKRVVLVNHKPSKRIMLLKILSNLKNSKNASSFSAIENSLQRAGFIRSRHPAFTQLIDYMWTSSGLVTVNEYIPDTQCLEQVGSISLQRLTSLLIHLLDAVMHIHDNSSFHGDISLSNVIINNLDDLYLVDYDFADPLPDFARTTYRIKRENWNEINIMQSADYDALKRITISTLKGFVRNKRNNTLKDVVQDHVIQDATQLIRTINHKHVDLSTREQVEELANVLRSC
jgi:serine/threonine protein kinase